MSEYTRTGTALIVLAVGLTGMAVAVVGWNRATNSTRQTDQQRQTVIVFGPSEQGMVLEKRIKAKTRVVKRLLEGDLTLVEAAAWFRDLNDNPPELGSNFRQAFPGRSDGEKACRQVLAWVATQIEQEMTQSQAEMVRCRLEGELAALLAQSDSIELPW